jgi:peptidyl-prolyl cis-trans isomerase SurA
VLKKKSIIVFFLCLVCYRLPLKGQDILDGIVAIVGEEMILRSELTLSSQQAAMQMRINPVNQPEMYKDLKEKVLNNLINQKVLLAKAKEDTVIVEDQRVETAMEERIQYMAQELGSIENVEKQFGAPISKIKRDNWNEMKNSLIIQTLQAGKLNEVMVSRREVENFYESVKDSIPDRKPAVKLRHLLLEIRPGEGVRNVAIGKLTDIRNRMGEGDNFEEMAKQYSEDSGTAANGGNLGWVEKGTFPGEFEEAAFRLNPGEISEIVESPVGLHLIQMVEKKENEAEIRHILVRLKAKQSDEEMTLGRLNEIRDRALSGESFETLAEQYSNDETTRKDGGNLDWWVLEEIEIQEFKSAVDTLQPKEISHPFKTQFGYHIVYVEEKEGARKASLEQDWDLIHDRALTQKKEKFFNEWIEELKKKIRIEIKEDMI